MKKLSLLLFMACFAFSLSAQRTISGTVIDNAGEALIGVNITAAGTTVGTISDIDGTYTLSVPDGSENLIFSYTGYTTQEVPIGSSSVLDITLSEGLELEEIVVTGLGIKKEKKALGYGVSTISNEAVANRQEADVARILRGKATGVDITQTSGMAGTGTNVIIRGYSSITGENQPLFVVDGIPFNTSTNTTSGFGAGGATASSRFLDLDPNNIAEISILKGLSATVLYGEAGRNGVILVTTKNGVDTNELNKGMEISVTQSLSRSDISNIPDYQDSYGNGFSGGFGWFFSNWGAAFDDLNPSTYGSSYQGEENGQVIITHPYDQPQYNDDLPEFIGAKYIYQPYPSVENFFEPGLSRNTSISIENKLGDNASISATYSYLADKGFTPALDEQRGGGPSNFLNKHNFGLGAQATLTNGVRVKGSFNYVDSERRVPITGQAFGGDGQGIFAALLFTPRSMDLMGLPYQSPLDGSNVYYRRGAPIQNPRWILNNGGNDERVQRFFSTTEVSYDLTDNLKAVYRLGIDQYGNTQVNTLNKGGAQQPDGSMATANFNERITDQLANILYNFNLTDDIDIDGIVGFNARRNVFEGNFLFSSQQFVYGLFNHGNYIEHNAGSTLSEENTLGAYATATVGYKSYLYLGVQARNDWTSTLESGNNSVFYPSVSMSFIPTDAIESLQNNSIINYLKLRLGYGTSAGYPNPYQTRNVLGTSTNSFVTNGGSILNTNTVANRLGNPNLTHELHTELEGGVEARFLSNRVSVDLSLYDRESSDLIIDLNLDPATGFTNTTVNAASVQNKGVELGLTFEPIRGDFNWDFTLNYTKNISEVTKISDGVEQIQISNNGSGINGTAGFTGGLGNYAVLGQPYGIMQGSAYQRDDEGNILVDGQGAYTLVDGGLNVIGDPNPNYNANWINNLSYKGFSVGWQFSYVDGGDVFSSTVQALMARGNTIDTDVDRFVPLIMPGVKGSDGSPNDIQTYIGDTFFRAYFWANEGGVFDGTTVRLREVSAAYTLPKSLLEGTPFGRVGISISGENLWYNAPNFPVGINFDPEVLSLGVGNGRGFDFRTAPTAKKYGITLNATF